MLGGELLVDLQIEIALQVADRKDEADLRTEADNTRLEGAEGVAGAAVAGELLIVVATRPTSICLETKCESPQSRCASMPF